MDRKTAIDDLFWNAELGAWFDYDLDFNKSRTDFFPSNIFPLLANCTNQDYKEVETAQKILNYVKVSSDMNTCSIVSGNRLLWCIHLNNTPIYMQFVSYYLNYYTEA
jgi:neutral trehalase